MKKTVKKPLSTTRKKKPVKPVKAAKKPVKKAQKTTSLDTHLQGTATRSVLSKETSKEQRKAVDGMRDDFMSDRPQADPEQLQQPEKEQTASSPSFEIGDMMSEKDRDALGEMLVDLIHYMSNLIALFWSKKITAYSPDQRARVKDVLLSQSDKYMPQVMAFLWPYLHPFIAIAVVSLPNIIDLEAQKITPETKAPGETNKHDLDVQMPNIPGAEAA